MLKLNKYNKGVSLIEVLAGIVVLSIALVAISNAVIRALQAADYARQKTKATKLTTQAMEWLRSQKESMSWSDFVGKTGDWCLKGLNWDIHDKCGTGDEVGQFKRDLSLTSPAICVENQGVSDNVVRSEVVVSWDNGNKDVRVTTCFSKWALEVTPEP